MAPLKPNQSASEELLCGTVCFQIPARKRRDNRTRSPSPHPRKRGRRCGGKDDAHRAPVRILKVATNCLQYLCKFNCLHVDLLVRLIAMVKHKEMNGMHIKGIGHYASNVVCLGHAPSI